jgi:hypothetical protein
LTMERVLYISWGYFEQFMELWNGAWHDSRPFVEDSCLDNDSATSWLSTSGVRLCPEFRQSET